MKAGVAYWLQHWQDHDSCNEDLCDPHLKPVHVVPSQEPLNSNRSRLNLCVRPGLNRLLVQQLKDVPQNYLGIWAVIVKILLSFQKKLEPTAGMTTMSACPQAFQSPNAHSEK